MWNWLFSATQVHFQRFTSIPDTQNHDQQFLPQLPISNSTTVPTSLKNQINRKERASAVWFSCDNQHLNQSMFWRTFMHFFISWKHMSIKSHNKLCFKKGVIYARKHFVWLLLSSWDQPSPLLMAKRQKLPWKTDADSQTTGILTVSLFFTSVGSNRIEGKILHSSQEGQNDENYVN